MDSLSLYRLFPVDSVVKHLMVLRSFTASHQKAAVEGGDREKILIVISLANDLWSIFRLEPYAERTSGPFP